MKARVKMRREQPSKKLSEAISNITESEFDTYIEKLKENTRKIKESRRAKHASRKRYRVIGLAMMIISIILLIIWLNVMFCDFPGF